MSIDGDLLRLARERDTAATIAVEAMLLERPDIVRKRLRDYIFRQVDQRRIKRVNESIPELLTLEGGINQLTCPAVEFSSGAQLRFDIQLESGQGGWHVLRFRFQVRLQSRRSTRMVQIHLNPQSSHDPLTIPRCHLHIDQGQAHVPFPVMDPRLMLHVICEHIAPDLGT
ncbi:MAG: hypothetical protein P4K98_08650 [Bryobacteraceae bacterium]|nr:hypothetical protein [Bryobacteraceae bacterium]